LPIEESASESLPTGLPGDATHEHDTPQLDTTIDYLSGKLGDWPHRRSNRTQARNLLQEYGVPEPLMAELLHQAYIRTKEAGPDNPMAYCFSVVRQLLHDRPPPRGGDRFNTSRFSPPFGDGRCDEVGRCPFQTRLGD
jgi:hypothetical protein